MPTVATAVVLVVVVVVLGSENSQLTTREVTMSNLSNFSLIFERKINDLIRTQTIAVFMTNKQLIR